MYCGFLFRGTKPRCASRRSITSTIPRQATSPPTLAQASPPPLALWFPAKANSKPAGSRSPCSHSAQGHSVGLDDLDLQGRTKRPIQSHPRDLDASSAFWWTPGLDTHAQDLSHPINQVILTHPVTWRRLAEQRRCLSGLDGTSNTGLMGKDTTSASVITCVLLRESCCVWSKNTVGGWSP